MNIFIASILFWLAFIVVASLVDLRRAEKAMSLSVLDIPERLLLGTFLIIDVIYNYTYGSLLFMEVTPRRCYTLTARLKYYIYNRPGTKRYRLAKFMCKYLIEPWDFGHCSLR